MKELFEELQKRIVKIIQHRKPDKVIVSFSGGKDSSLLTEVVLHSAKRYPDVLNEYVSELIIANIDTGLEYPVIYQLLSEDFKRIESYFDTLNLKTKLKFDKVKPNVRNNFWFYLIGKGYTLPDSRIKLCQSTMKINTFKMYSKQFNPATDIFIVGTRQDESSARRKILSNLLNENIYLHKVNYLEVYTPIYDITTQSVWKVLKLLLETNQNVLPIDKLVELYQTAKQHLECGRGIKCEPRFGCLVCTVIRKDRTLDAVIKATNDNVLKKLAKFKKLLIEFYNEPENHTWYDRKGNRVVNRLLGVLTFKARKKLLRELLKLEKNTGLKLISDDVINAIKRQLEIDKRRPLFT